MAVMDHKDGKAASGTRPAALPSFPIQCRGSHRDAVRALAIGTASDPELGSPLFVSSHRIGVELHRVAWNSTTPYLSVLVAPRLAPTRLVVDPDAGYFWLSCQTARQSEASSTAIPEATRRLVRIYACLHR